MKMQMDSELLKLSKHIQHLRLQNQEFVEVDVHVKNKEKKGTVIKLHCTYLFHFCFPMLYF